MESSQSHDSAEAELIRREIAFLRRASPHYVFHEYLEEFNQPVLFRDFATDTAAAGLTYLCDAQNWPSGNAVQSAEHRIEANSYKTSLACENFAAAC